MNKGIWKKLFINTLVFLVVSIMAELFVFNYQSLSTVNEQEIVVPLDYCTYEGLTEHREDGTIVLDKGENGAYIQVPLEDSSIELNNIALKVTCIDGYEGWWGYMRTQYATVCSTAVKATVLIYDGNNVILRDRLLYGRGDEKEIINTPEIKQAAQLVIQLSGLKGRHLLLSGISLNVPVSMHFIPLRVLAVFGLLAFIYHFRPGSFLWTERLLDENGKFKRKYLMVAIAFAIAASICIPFMISRNQVYMQSENAFHPYTDLARALAKGHLCLDVEPSAELLALDDPYDPIQREELRVPFQLDYALYEGRYYIYFGVIPCLLLYLPWYLVSGTDLPGWIALSIMIILCYAGLWIMLKNIVRRYRPDMAAGPALLLWMGAASIISLPAAMGDANNYYAPMLAALDCFFFGMALSISASDDMEAGKLKSGRIKLFFGSLLMAFIAGCRPQLVLGAVCTIPVLLHVLFVKKDGKYRPDIADCTVFAVPYIIVAVVLMIYNALRFGSPFDFGAMKNLTFAFLSNAGFSLTAAGAGVFYYLFRLPYLTVFYPYMDRSVFDWSNPNVLASHPSIGGIFMLYPVLFLAFACVLKQKIGRDTELKRVGISALLLVPALAAVTATMGGLMDRYRMDIAPFAALALVCGGICFMASDIIKMHINIQRIILVVLVALSVIVSGLTYATEGLNYLQDVNPEAYMDIAKAIEFWR